MTVVYGYWNNGSPGDICSSSLNDLNVDEVDKVDIVDPVVVVDVIDALVDEEEIGELDPTIYFNPFWKFTLRYISRR